MKKKLLYLSIILAIALTHGDDRVQCKQERGVFHICKKEDTLIYVNQTRPDEVILTIEDSNLKTIAPNAFQGLLIEGLHLNFTNNSMKIQPESFKGLNKVHDLQISCGNISLQPRVFKTLTSLKELTILCKNVELKKEAFADLSMLRSLELMGSGISIINKDTFSGANNGLLRLLMWNNSISHIEPWSFTDFSNLDFLRLGYNQMSDLQPGTFHGLNNLKMLNLDHNQLTIVRKNVFNELKKLRHLELGFNNINVIEDEAFVGLGPMTLSLQNNKLISISSRAFEGTRIYGLNLANNGLLCIDPDAFKDLTFITIFFKNNNVTIDKEKWGLGSNAVVVDDDHGKLHWTPTFEN